MQQPRLGAMEALDPEPLLRFLHERGVEHVLIGGVAVAAHGYRRPSKDLDIVPAPNAEDLAQGGNFRLETDLGALDIMQWVSGIDADDLFGELDRDALMFMLDDVPVRYCSLGHLRTMKNAAGRPRDLDDLQHLPSQ